MFLLCITTQFGFSQEKPTKKEKLIEGSIMAFTDVQGTKFGIGACSPLLVKINTTKDLKIGISISAIFWQDYKTHVHNYGQAGTVIRLDYKKLSLGYNILTISGIDTSFVGIGYKF